MPSVINRAQVRRLILERAKVVRPSWGVQRVSGTALDLIDAKVRVMVGRMLEEHPSAGVTFYGE